MRASEPSDGAGGQDPREVPNEKATHQIRWEDDGAVGYSCTRDRGAMHTIHGLDEGDKIVTCPSCGARLKGSWCVTLTMMIDEPEADPSRLTDSE